MTQNAIMIDIETLATSEDAAILSIGACMFDPRGAFDQPINETFHQRISLESNEEASRKFEAGTIEWWFKQSTEAQQALFEDTTNLQQALTMFRHWYEHETNCRPETVWANSPSFDCAIIKSACTALQMRGGWHFSIERDVRTAGEMAYPAHKERKAVMKTIRDALGTHHRADDDAIAQARFVIHCFETLRSG